ncbi:hypothetical protein CCHR01_10936 [Colletotrichum chrysophilum]|uniref:Uncharacterized protein n=1 Tax=Colletotrichum chrysophilum TaxID=1836956 RepID=A0AAD9AE61_9PEZI|nr:hypothetical protein CCHR01_10936 [Colletotrichum chrysophilum]
MDGVKRQYFGNGRVMVMRRIRGSAKETRQTEVERWIPKTSFGSGNDIVKIAQRDQMDRHQYSRPRSNAWEHADAEEEAGRSRHITNMLLLRGGAQSGSDGSDVLHVTNGSSIASYCSTNTHSSLAVGFFRLSATRGPSESNQKQPCGASGSIFAEQALKPIKRQNQGQRAILASRSQQQERLARFPFIHRHPPPNPTPDPAAAARTLSAIPALRFERLSTHSTDTLPSLR